MKIVVCLPGSSFSSNFLLSWSMLIDSCYKKNINLIISPGVSSNVAIARSKTLGYSSLGGLDQLPFQGKLEYDYIMFLDSDILFKPDDFFALLESPHDVTSGIYMMQDSKNLATCTKWDTEYFLKNGHFEFLSSDDIESFKKTSSTKYMSVVYTGMGFTLIKKGVLEKLKYPIFWTDLQNIESTDSTKPNVVDLVSEDVALFLNLQKAGIKCHIDTTIRVGHEKLVVL